MVTPKNKIQPSQAHQSSTRLTRAQTQRSILDFTQKEPKSEAALQKSSSVKEIGSEQANSRHLMHFQSSQHYSLEELPSDEEKQIELAIALSLQESENLNKQLTSDSLRFEHILDISPRKVGSPTINHEANDESNRENEILEFDLTQLDELPDKDDIVTRTPVRRGYPKSALNTRTLQRFAHKLNITTPNSSPVKNVHSPISSTSNNRSHALSASPEIKFRKALSNVSSPGMRCISSDISESPNLDTSPYLESKSSPRDEQDSRSRNSSSPLFSRCSSRMVICSSPEQDSLNDFDILPAKSATHISRECTSSPKAVMHIPYDRPDVESFPISPTNSSKLPKMNPMFSPSTRLSNSPQRVKRQLNHGESDTLSLTPTKRRPESFCHPASDVASNSSIRRAERSGHSGQSEVKDNDFISCPVCQKEFPKNVIEIHASDCNGPTTSPTIDIPVKTPSPPNQTAVDFGSIKAHSPSLKKHPRSLRHVGEQADIFQIATDSYGDDIADFSDEESRVFAPISTKGVLPALPLSPTTFGLDDPFGPHTDSSQTKGKAKVTVANPINPPSMKSQSLKSKATIEKKAPNRVIGRVTKKPPKSRSGLHMNTELPANVGNSAIGFSSTHTQSFDYSMDDYENGYIWDGDSSDQLSHHSNEPHTDPYSPTHNLAAISSDEDEGYSSPLEGFTNLHEHKDDPELMKYMSQFEPSARRRAAKKAKEEDPSSVQSSTANRKTTMAGRRNKWASRRKWKYSKKKGAGSSKAANRRYDAGTTQPSLVTTRSSSAKTPQHNYYNDDPGFGAEGFRWETRGVAAYAGWRL